MDAENGRKRMRAAIVAIGPAALFAAFIYHPYIGLGPPDNVAIATAAASNPTRWGLAHISAGLASALFVLTFLAVRSYLRDTGDDPWSARAVPAIVVSGTLYAMLPGMELAAILGAIETGADLVAAQHSIRQWFIPVIAASGITFVVACFNLARGIARSEVLSRPWTYLVVTAFAVMAGSRLVPLAATQFYAQGLLSLLAFWPLAYQMWKSPETQDAASPLPIPAR